MLILIYANGYMRKGPEFQNAYASECMRGFPGTVAGIRRTGFCPELGKGELPRLLSLRNLEEETADPDFLSICDDDHVQAGLLFDDQRVQVDVDGRPVRLRIG